MYIFGGYDGSNRVNDFHKFDFKRQKWSQINTTATPSARDRHVVVSFGKSLFIFGGYDGNNSKPVFDPNPRYLKVSSHFCRVSRVHENLGKFPTISCRFLP